MRFTAMTLPLFFALLTTGNAAAADKGYLGVELKAFGFGPGVLIAGVAEDGPAARAGVRELDVLKAIDGEAVRSQRDVVLIIGAHKSGDTIQLTLQRGNETVELEATLGTRPQVDVVPRADVPEKEKSNATAKSAGFLGVGYADVPEMLSVHLGLKVGDGVLVGGVHKESAAGEAGIERFDVIVKIDGEIVRGGRGLVKLMSGKSAGDEVSVELIHRGKATSKKLTLGERPAGLAKAPWGHPGPGMPGWFGPHGQVFPHGMPRRQGRFHLGDEVFELPFPNAYESLRQLLEERGEFDPHTWQRFEEAFKGLDGAVERSESSQLHVIEDGFEIKIVTDAAGTRVTVSRDGEMIADNVPYDKIDSLPEDVQERVRTLMKKHEVKPSDGATTPSKPIEPSRGIKA